MEQQGPSTREVTMDEVALVMKALADPNRLRILARLMQGDSCNCELAEQLDIPSSLLSHHMRILRQAGLVRSRRDTVDARWIYCAVDRSAVARWRAWLHAFLDPARIQERCALCGPEGRLQQVVREESVAQVYTIDRAPAEEIKII